MRRWLNAASALALVLVGLMAFYRLAGAGSLEALGGSTAGLLTNVDMQGRDGVQINGTSNTTVTSTYFLIDLGPSITVDEVLSNTGSPLTLNAANGSVVIAAGDILSGDSASFTSGTFTTMTATTIRADVFNSRTGGTVQLNNTTGFGFGNDLGANLSIVTPGTGVLTINITTASGGMVLNAGDWYGGGLAFITTVNVTDATATNSINAPLANLTTVNVTNGQAISGGWHGALGNLTTLNVTKGQSIGGSWNGPLGNLTTLNVTNGQAVSGGWHGPLANLTTVNVTNGQAVSGGWHGALANLTTLNVTNGQAVSGGWNGPLGNLTTVNVTTLNAMGSSGTVSSTMVRTETINVTTQQVDLRPADEGGMTYSVTSRSFLMRTLMGLTRPSTAVTSTIFESAAITNTTNATTISHVVPIPNGAIRPGKSHILLTLWNYTSGTSSTQTISIRHYVGPNGSASTGNDCVAAAHSNQAPDSSESSATNRSLLTITWITWKSTGPSAKYESTIFFLNNFLDSSTNTLNRSGSMFLNNSRNDAAAGFPHPNGNANNAATIANSEAANLVYKTEWTWGVSEGAATSRLTQFIVWEVN